MFSRFCWFYGWTDTHVLRMPARRFWMMERQIDRIRAEDDIRQVNLHSTITPPSHQSTVQRLNEYLGKLTLEIGDKFTVRRNMLVAPEPDAAAKFRNITGG